MEHGSSEKSGCCQGVKCKRFERSNELDTCAIKNILCTFLLKKLSESFISLCGKRSTPNTRLTHLIKLCSVPRWA